jgi:hypothetical protein
LQSSRAFSVRVHIREKGRLGVAAGGGPFGRRTAIVLELKQGQLPVLGGFPSLKLPAAEFANLLPAMGVAPNKKHVWLRHGGCLRGVCLGGCGFLQSVKEVRRALRMGCRGEDRPLARLPVTIVSSKIGNDLNDAWREAQRWRSR